MPESSDFTPMRSPARKNHLWMVVTATLYLIAAVAAVVAARHDQLVVGGIGLIAILATAPIALMMANDRADPTSRTKPASAAQAEELIRLLRAINDRAVLSDDARRVLNRTSERDMLVQEIDNAIVKHDWPAAGVLVRELSDRIGFPEDADRLRRKIDQARTVARDASVKDEISYLDGLILQRRWDVAFADAARIQRLYPDSPAVLDLPRRVEFAKAEVKQELQARFLEAAKNDRGTEAMETLRELDNYLSEQEAEPLREAARQVIGRVRDGLGAEFKRCLQERQYRRGVEVGERIMAEFPNTRMAEEIRGMIDSVREKAGMMARS
jgi:hypothetical protein